MKVWYAEVAGRYASARDATFGDFDRTRRAVRWVVGCPRSEVMRLEPFGIEGFELVRSGHSTVTLFQNVTLQSFSHTNANVTLYENL